MSPGASSTASGTSTDGSVVTAVRPVVDLEVVIPAFNEESRLPATLDRTLRYLDQQPYTAAVVVVDNGSQDGTARVARAFGGGSVPVHVVGWTQPGKGSAVRRGFATSSAHLLGFMDADLATPVETLDRVVPLLQAGHAAVIGSRRAPGSEFAVPQGALRRFGGNAFRAAARSLLPTVEDSQCGFKFFRGPIARAISARCRVDGFSFDVELLARLHRAGHGIVEVGVTWTDVEGSTFSPLRHGLRSFSDTVRIHRLLADTRVRSAPAELLGRAAVAGGALSAAS